MKQITRRQHLMALILIGLLTAGCARVGYSSSAQPSVSATASASPRPFIQTPQELAAYARERRAALAAAADSGSADDDVRAAVILRQPLRPADVESILSEAGIADEFFYFAWSQADSAVAGGAQAPQLAELLHEYPSLRINYLNVETRIRNLSALAADAQVWLVDIGGDENYYELARSGGLL